MVDVGTEASSTATAFQEEPLSCFFNGKVLGEGQSVTAYLNSTPEFTNGCVSETRTCKNNVLSGSFTFASCKTGLKACLFNGITIQSGDFIAAYDKPVNGQCSSQKRTCTDGKLSGTYLYSSCTAGACLFEGRTLKTNETFTYYLNSLGTSTASCEPRTGHCQADGTLADSNNQLLTASIYASCSESAASCYFDGRTLSAGQEFSYSKDPIQCTSLVGYCDTNGQLRNKSTQALLAAPFYETNSCLSCKSQGGVLQADQSCKVAATVPQIRSKGYVCDIGGKMGWRADQTPCPSGTLAASAEKAGNCSTGAKQYNYNNRIGCYYPMTDSRKPPECDGTSSTQECCFWMCSATLGERSIWSCVNDGYMMQTCTDQFGRVKVISTSLNP